MSFHFPKIIGHRGAAGLAPENTLAGFELAANLGVQAIEVDLRLSKDHQIYLMHDDHLLRMCGDERSVENLTSSQLEQIRIRSGHYNEKIPTFEETIKLVNRHGLYINLELKTHAKNAEALVQTLALKLKNINHDPAKILITSFDEQCTEFCFKYLSAYKRGLLLKFPSENWQEKFKKYELSCLILNGMKNDTETLKKCIQTGIAVLGYTINDTRKVETLLHLGLCSIFTDVPDQMKKWIS